MAGAIHVVKAAIFSGDGRWKKRPPAAARRRAFDRGRRAT
jgi:hypothetical protein